jgi:hypothetical protein
MKAGETLDGIGGYNCYGQIENCAGGDHPGLPICLAESLVLQTDVPRDAPIPMTAVCIPEGRADFEMYAAAVSAGCLAGSPPGDPDSRLAATGRQGSCRRALFR